MVGADHTVDRHFRRSSTCTCLSCTAGSRASRKLTRSARGCSISTSSLWLFEVVRFAMLCRVFAVVMSIPSPPNSRRWSLCNSRRTCFSALHPCPGFAIRTSERFHLSLVPSALVRRWSSDSSALILLPFPHRCRDFQSVIKRRQQNGGKRMKPDWRGLMRPSGRQILRQSLMRRSQTRCPEMLETALMRVQETNMFYL